MDVYSGVVLAVLINVTLFTALARGALFFPSNSAYGIFAAIAVPLDLPNRNVFISYNFEANYNLPQKYEVPVNLEGIVNDNFYEEDAAARQLSPTNCVANCTESTSSEQSTEGVRGGEETVADAEGSEGKQRKRRSLLTREHFYYILRDKFKRAGYNEHTCLLRLICETNASQLGDNNGVLGSLVHVLFSPSTSEFENLPLEYYQAEYDGIHHDCQHYEQECKENILDLISKPLHKIIDEMMYRM